MKLYGNVILMTLICVVIFMAFMALRPAQADAVYDAFLCRVMDPIGTPLNARATPNGPIVGRLNNGEQVTVFDPPSDRTDKSWVYARNYEDGSISRPVRYSRVRTGELTVFGAASPPARFSTIFPRRWNDWGTCYFLL